MHRLIRTPLDRLSRAGLAILFVAATAGADGPPPTATPSPEPGASATPPAAGSVAPATPGPRGEPRWPDRGGPAPGQEELPEPAIVVLEPPDGVWLKDEEGQEYYFTRVRKDAGYWMRAGDHVYFRALKAKVEKEDETYFFIRRLRVDSDQAAPPPVEHLPPIGTPSEPTDATIKAVLPLEVERLQALDFGRGLPRSGQWRNGFDVADVDGDGKPDLVHGPARKGEARPHVFLGDGRGGWRAWTEASFPDLPFDYGDAAVADFNRDGHPDIALANHLRGIVVLYGDGKGAFVATASGLPFQRKKGRSQEVFSSRAIAARDLDRDGWPDLVSIGEGPGFVGAATERAEIGAGSFGVRAFRNQRDGSWAVPWSSAASKAEPFGDSLAVADFDGDRQVDLAIGTSLTGFTEILYYGLPRGGWKPAALEGLPPQPLVSAIRTADLNDDKRPDLVVSTIGWRDGEFFTSVDWFENLGRRQWRRHNLVVQPGSEPIRAVAIGNFERDSMDDIALLGPNGALWLVLRSPGRPLELQRFAEHPQRCRGYSLKAADIDGDGQDELVAGFAQEPSASALDLSGAQCPTAGGLLAWRFQPRSAMGK